MFAIASPIARAVVHLTRGVPTSLFVIIAPDAQGARRKRQCHDNRERSADGSQHDRPCSGGQLVGASCHGLSTSRCFSISPQNAPANRESIRKVDLLRSTSVGRAKRVCHAMGVNSPQNDDENSLTEIAAASWDRLAIVRSIHQRSELDVARGTKAVQRSYLCGPMPPRPGS